jgi:hypothetical protein
MNQSNTLMNQSNTGLEKNSVGLYLLRAVELS